MSLEKPLGKAMCYNLSCDRTHAIRALWMSINKISVTAQIKRSYVAQNLNVNCSNVYLIVQIWAGLRQSFEGQKRQNVIENSRKNDHNFSSLDHFRHSKLFSLSRAKNKIFFSSVARLSGSRFLWGKFLESADER